TAGCRRRAPRGSAASTYAAAPIRRRAVSGRAAGGSAGPLLTASLPWGTPRPGAEARTQSVEPETDVGKRVRRYAASWRALSGTVWNRGPRNEAPEQRAHLPALADPRHRARLPPGGRLGA